MDVVEGLTDLVVEPGISGVAEERVTSDDNANEKQKDKKEEEEQNPDARVPSTILADTIGTIQALRIELYEVLALDPGRIFGPKLPPGTSSVALQTPGITSAASNPLAHATPSSSFSVLIYPPTTSTDMNPMNAPQLTRKLPEPACAIKVLIISATDREDIGDIVSTSLTFDYQGVYLLLNGSLGSNSQFERNRMVPEGTIPTRANSTASPGTPL